MGAVWGEGGKGRRGGSGAQALGAPYLPRGTRLPGFPREGSAAVSPGQGVTGKPGHRWIVGRFEHLLLPRSEESGNSHVILGELAKGSEGRGLPRLLSAAGRSHREPGDMGGQWNLPEKGCVWGMP